MEKQKRNRLIVFGLSLLAYFCFVAAFVWALLDIAIIFGATEWLTRHHLHPDEMFPGVYGIIFSVYALILGGAICLLSYFLEKKYKKSEVNTEEGDKLATRLKAVQEFEGLDEKIHLMMEEEQEK